MFFNLRVLIGEKDTGPNGIFGIIIILLRVYFSQSFFITGDCRFWQKHTCISNNNNNKFNHAASVFIHVFCAAG